MTTLRSLGALGLATWLCVAAATAHPSLSGGEGLLDVRSAEVPEAGAISIGVSGFGYTVQADQEPGATESRDIWDGGLSADYVYDGWLQGFARVDAAWITQAGRRPIAFRDGLFGVKAALPGNTKWLQMGVVGSVNLPWGNEPRGFSTGSLDPNLTALLTVPLPESNTLTSAKLHFNLGYQWHGDDNGRTFDGRPLYFLEPVYPDQANKDRIDLRAAVEFGSDRLTLFTEVLLDQLRSDGVAFVESPLFITPGFRFSVSESMSFLLASKIALAGDDVSTKRYRQSSELFPDWQFGFGLTWTRTGPNADRDGDGVPDFRDRCPRTAEDLDGWEDDDGCPEWDNDSDRIPDEFDAAPNEAEDFDGYLDSDGAPDPDNDGDGILDGEDSCPNDAEDFDGLEDQDGCPETDVDGDGIPDTDDECPEQPESLNGIEDNDGCPEELGLLEPYLVPGLVWKGPVVAPEPVSFPELTELADRLQRSPSTAVELRVYPGEYDDPLGNGELSKQRGEYIRGFLVASGVSPSRLSVSGTTKVEADALATGRNQVFARKTVLEVVPKPTEAVR